MMALMGDAIDNVPGVRGVGEKTAVELVKQFGTLEELTETLTWAQLGLHARPVGLLDPTGYFDDLRRFVDRMVTEGFLPAACRDLLRVASDPDDLLDRLAADVRPSPHGRPLDRI